MRDEAFRGLHDVELGRAHAALQARERLRDRVFVVPHVGAVQRARTPERSRPHHGGGATHAFEAEEPLIRGLEARRATDERHLCGKMAGSLLVERGCKQRLRPAQGCFAEFVPLVRGAPQHALRPTMGRGVVVAEPEARAPPLRPRRAELLEVHEPIRERPGDEEADRSRLSRSKVEANAETCVPGGPLRARPGVGVWSIALRIGFGLVETDPACSVGEAA